MGVTGREVREQTLNALREARCVTATCRVLRCVKAREALKKLAPCVIAQYVRAAQILTASEAAENDSHLLDGRNFDPAPFDAALARLGETP